jgi:hypothetical protein
MTEPAAPVVEVRRLERLVSRTFLLAAGVLIVGQFCWLAWMAKELRASCQVPGICEHRFPSDQWRYWGVFIPLVLFVVPAVLKTRRTGGAWPALAVGLFLLMFASLLAGIAREMGALKIDSVRLRDGRTYILAIEPVLTDSVYTLYETKGPLGLYWKWASGLDYSEDGRFTGGERLIISRDLRWLLVTRGGVWTDCFSVAQRQLRPCQDIESVLDWSSPTYEAGMHERSRRIAALTGMRVP